MFRQSCVAFCVVSLLLQSFGFGNPINCCLDCEDNGSNIINNSSINNSSINTTNEEAGLLSNREKLIELIESKAQQIGKHSIYHYIAYESIVPETERFAVLNKFIAFSITFSDAMTLISDKYKESLKNKDDIYGKEIYLHAIDDIGHFNMLINDWTLRHSIDSIQTNEIVSLLYNKKHLFQRKYGYQIIKNCLLYLDNPLYLAYLLEAFEATSKEFLQGFGISLKMYKKATNKTMTYFDNNHLNIEYGHKTLFDTFKQNINDNDYKNIKNIIIEHFNNAKNMLDESLKCTIKYEYDNYRSNTKITH